ncbi:MAG TPA: signal peptidase II [Gemmatimonadales bacterium]|nr:signal peptidase II [Gemmatimonadales bacterium]
MSASRAPVRLLLAVAFAVVAVDLASKAVAIILLADSYVEVGGPFFLSLLFNDALFAGSTTLNGMALPLSFLGSLILVALALPVCAPLSEHDSRAPVALGLMVGAAIANPASLALQPAGVTDFLGISFGGTSIIFNLADVAVYAGIVMCGRTVTNVLAAHRAQRRSVVRRPARSAHLEREIPLAVWQDAQVERTERIPVPIGIPVVTAHASESHADVTAPEAHLHLHPPA